MQVRFNGPMSRTLDTLGSRVAFARKRRKLSQEKLAELAGVKQPDISKIERGDIKQPAAIARLAYALRVSPRWLELLSDEEPAWESPEAPKDAAPVAGLTDALRTTLEAVSRLNRLQADMVCQAIRSLAENPEMLDDACSTLTPILEGAQRKQILAA